MSSSEIQAVIFPKATWSIAKSKKWLKDNSIKPIKSARETLNFYRYRIQDPKLFYGFITKKLNNGVELVIGVNST